MLRNRPTGVVGAGLVCYAGILHRTRPGGQGTSQSEFSPWFNTVGLGQNPNEQRLVSSIKKVTLVANWPYST